MAHMTGGTETVVKGEHYMNRVATPDTSKIRKIWKGFSHHFYLGSLEVANNLKQESPYLFLLQNSLGLTQEV